jgi:hypothetical protein
LCGGDDARLVLVIRGRAISNYRASFNRIYSVGSPGGWVQGSKLNPLEPLTPPLTTDFAKSKSKKVDVDTALLKKVQSEDMKAEMKRTKEAKEAKNIEASEGRQNAIGEANRLAEAKSPLQGPRERWRRKVEVKCLTSPTKPSWLQNAVGEANAIEEKRKRELKEKRVEVEVEAKVEAKSLTSPTIPHRGDS